MSKAVRLNVHPRVITLAKILDRGERSFNELHMRDRMLLYDRNFDLDGLVSTEEKLNFRIELAKEGKLPLTERVKAHAQLVALNAE
jgi:hypothetical protein